MNPMVFLEIVKRIGVKLKKLTQILNTGGKFEISHILHTLLRHFRETLLRLFSTCNHSGNITLLYDGL